MFRRLVARVLRPVRRVCEVMDLYTFPAQGTGPSPDPARSLEDATAPVLRQMRETYPEDLDERKYGILVDRLDHPDDRTLIIRDEQGEPCGYCHITLQDTRDERTNYAIPLSPHQGYLWDDRIFAAHRRRALHTFSIARRLELIVDEGRAEGVTMIARHNRASRSSYAAFGTVRQRVLYYLPPWYRTFSRSPVRRPRVGGRA